MFADRVVGVAEHRHVMVQLVIFGLMMAVDALNSLTLRVLSDLLSINRVLIEEHTSGSRRCSAA